jgi:hypothetical protein
MSFITTYKLYPSFSLRAAFGATTPILNLVGDNTNRGEELGFNEAGLFTRLMFNNEAVVGGSYRLEYV